MKKICVVTGYRSDYTKLKSVLFHLKKLENIKLEIVVFGVHLLDDYGKTLTDIEKDGHKISASLSTNVEGSTPITMSKSIGLAIVELSGVYERSKPDAVLVVGDRCEIFAAAIAASISNIPVVHIQGGEVSGTIDEVIRHSITKLSHVHFPSTELSTQRIIKMGENPEFVFNVGCPAVDLIKTCDYFSDYQLKKMHRSIGVNLRSGEPYIILIQHPVTTEFGASGKQMMLTLEALQEAGIRTLMLYPNPDAGTGAMLKTIRKFSKKYKKDSVICGKWKHLPFETYLNLLKNCACLVGNSSSGIREAHIFGTPVINIGSRQKGRERTKNIIDISHDKDLIKKTIKRYAGKKIYDDENLYGDGSAGKKIADILSSIDLKAVLAKKILL